MSGGSSGALDCAKKRENCVVPSVPHIFSFCLAQCRTLDTLRTHLLRNLNLFVFHLVPGDGQLQRYKKVSVDRNTATRTQTLKQSREGKKLAESPRKTAHNRENQQKLRDPAPTRGGPASEPVRPRPSGPCESPETTVSDSTVQHGPHVHGTKEVHNLAVVKAKIKIKNPRIRAGIGPKPAVSLGKWHSAPSLGAPRGRGAKKKRKKSI